MNPREREKKHMINNSYDLHVILLKIFLSLTRSQRFSWLKNKEIIGSGSGAISRVYAGLHMNASNSGENKTLLGVVRRLFCLVDQPHHKCSMYGSVRLVSFCIIFLLLL